MKACSFLILGNDKKMIACKDELSSMGYIAEIDDGSDLIKNIRYYDNIILPLPTLTGNKIKGTDLTIDYLLSSMQKNQRLFVGNVNICSSVKVSSYYYNEEFLLINSEYTAQGILRLVLENIDSYSGDTEVAVTGYGRCGKAICRLLNKCGFNVTSFSRRKETVNEALADKINAELIENIGEYIGGFSVVINTVPENIFSYDILKKINENAVYIETASAPYGFDKCLSESFEFRYILAAGLPGKYLPKSSGISIAKAVSDILKGEENG